MIRQPSHPFASLLSLLRGPTPQTARKRRAGRPRRLGFELCENRVLLDGASISGIKYLTANSSGFSANDTPQGGVFIDLYKDNGDTIFDVNTDTLADRQQTASPSGVYTFANVADGHYFIQEEVPTGFTQSAGPAFYTLDVINGGVYTGGTTNIDNFNDPDPNATYFINQFDPDPLLLQHSGSGIIGGQRDALIDVLGASNAISANGFVGTVSPGVGVFNLASASSGPGTAVTLQYDGTDADTTALNDAMGLTADLTTGGANGFRLDFNFLQIGSGPTIDVTVFATSTSGTATFASTIAFNTGAFSVFAPFSGFTTTGSFSFADVKSLKFSFNQGGELDVDFELDQIVAVQQKDATYNFGNFPITPAPSSLSGFVYCDGNNNGIKDTGEKGIACVKITLTGTDDLGKPVSLTTKTDSNGAYSFTNLRPGVYTITESQPLNFIDGKDTIGTPGGTTGNDVFSNITLPAGFSGVSNNFGELGLTTCFASKRSLCRPTPSDPLKACNPCNSKPSTSGNTCNSQTGKTSSSQCDTKKTTSASHLTSACKTLTTSGKTQSLRNLISSITKTRR